jgi:hypothetical protein
MMKRRALIAVTWLLASMAGVGCQMEVGDDSQSMADAAEVGEAEQAMPFNCVGICVAYFRACVRGGGTYADCSAEREGCKDVCDEQTCEPGEPGCCQGQPTCW